jgi:hypothetical protein
VPDVEGENNDENHPNLQEGSHSGERGKIFEFSEMSATH